jgi:citrate lyase subunit beta/citryl-CoA lyase
MRSLLFVPADSERKLARAPQSGADALILDLEDSVVPANRPAARRQARDFLESTGSVVLQRYARINPLSSGIALEDLAAVVPAKPDGILLPKCVPEDLRTLDHYLAALEAASALAAGSIRVITIATEPRGDVCPWRISGRVAPARSDHLGRGRSGGLSRRRQSAGRRRL